ncbi:hypothetical protein DOTSEDRAFT_45911 [Dothistroma septosporum NZE10]|uniref:Uncharacterized protein n=1 Tax=Dothistroma septosporum (strain NZE10 / CBS 128990) TaxID=675120 RepID=N1PM21_DOTSN|nr:hypothetical protein DOTSEDRAFT_45911 [Dothistroma septosporum NZE10]
MRLHSQKRRMSKVRVSPIGKGSQMGDRDELADEVPQFRWQRKQRGRRHDDYNNSRKSSSSRVSMTKRCRIARMIIAFFGAGSSPLHNPSSHRRADAQATRTRRQEATRRFPLPPLRTLASATLAA